MQLQFCLVRRRRCRTSSLSLPPSLPQLTSFQSLPSLHFAPSSSKNFPQPMPSCGHEQYKAPGLPIHTRGRSPTPRPNNLRIPNSDDTAATVILAGCVSIFPGLIITLAPALRAPGASGRVSFSPLVRALPAAFLPACLPSPVPARYRLWFGDDRHLRLPPSPRRHALTFPSLLYSALASISSHHHLINAYVKQRGILIPYTV